MAHISGCLRSQYLYWQLPPRFWLIFRHMAVPHSGRRNLRNRPAYGGNPAFTYYAPHFLRSPEGDGRLEILFPTATGSTDAKRQQCVFRFRHGVLSTSSVIQAAYGMSHLHDVALHAAYLKPECADTEHFEPVMVCLLKNVPKQPARGYSIQVIPPWARLVVLRKI